MATTEEDNATKLLLVLRMHAQQAKDEALAWEQRVESATAEWAEERRNVIALFPTIQEAARRLGFSEGIIKKAIKAGELSTFRPKGTNAKHLCFDELVEWVRDSKE